MLELSRIPSSHRSITTTDAQTDRIELWCLHGATDDLRGLAIETSFGHAFALELDRELVLLHLQPSPEALAEYAARIENALLAQGWRRANPLQPSAKERS